MTIDAFSVPSNKSVKQSFLFTFKKCNLDLGNFVITSAKNNSTYEPLNVVGNNEKLKSLGWEIKTNIGLGIDKCLKEIQKK